MISRTQGRSSNRRDDVLAALRSDGEALTISELAERLGTHPNTVRFHLEKLVASGRVEQAPVDHRRPGRPPLRFRVVPRMDPAGPRHYRLLAELLIRELASAPDGTSRAESAGRAWGNAVSAGHADRDTIGALVALLEELGFAPEAPQGADRSAVALTHCPFLELVPAGPGLVCQVHLGLMRGALEAWSSDVTVERLQPFVEPDRCLTRLGPVGAAA